MKLLVTGLTGLVGSRFEELLGGSYQFEQLNTSTGVDILNRASVSDKISSSKANLVLHFAAKSNVDGCEVDKQRDKQILNFPKLEEKENAWVKEKTAWALNVFGTQNVVNACKKTNKKIIYVSTDFVFNGQKKSYTEEDNPDPVNWYGKTKYEGEKLVQDSGIEFIIARPAYPYRAMFKRNDFVRAILDNLYKHESLKMITDHIMTPTFVDDLVNALDILIRTDQTGIFHVVGSQHITPYDASIKIAKEFDLDDSIISKTTRNEYFRGKAPRPFCLKLKNDKIQKLGIEMSSFDKGLREIKNQMKRIHI